MAYSLTITDNAEVVATAITNPSTGKVADIVDLETMKGYLKQSYSGVALEDTLIKVMIQSARKWLERYLNRSIIEKTIVAFTRDELGEFDLPLPPVASITSVERIDMSGTATTLTLNTDYYSIGVGDLTLQFMSLWGTSGNEPAGIKVTYTAKITDPVDLAACKMAVMMIVSDNYYTRGETTDEAVNQVPFDAKRIVSHLKLHRTL